MNQHIQIWDNFRSRMQVVESSVPLFKHSANQVVETKLIDTKVKRFVLCRSSQMEQIVRSETDKLVIDWKTQKDELDGLICMILLKKSGKVKPLYIGKAETIGKGNRNLSANIKNLDRDTSKFARWGDNYAYHIGDLSAVVIPGHDPKKKANKYLIWAKSLFLEFPVSRPRLKQDVFFWATA